MILKQTMSSADNLGDRQKKLQETRAKLLQQNNADRSAKEEKKGDEKDAGIQDNYEGFAEKANEPKKILDDDFLADLKFDKVDVPDSDDESYF